MELEILEVESGGVFEVCSDAAEVLFVGTETQCKNFCDTYSKQHKEHKMARKTKAEREAEAQVARALQEKMARDAYPELLMETLERAAKLSFDLRVRDGKFEVLNRNSPVDYWTLTYSYTPDADAELDMLRWEVEKQEQAEAEANRKYLAKQAALAKLSPEERELLGL